MAQEEINNTKTENSHQTNYMSVLNY